MTRSVAIDDPVHTAVVWSMLDGNFIVGEFSESTHDGSSPASEVHAADDYAS